MLAQIVNDWRRDHPHERVPGLLGDGKDIRRRRILNFAGGSTEIIHDKLEIYPLRFVRIARGVDGSCMVLTPHPKNTHAWVGYYAWLGGDLGFTEYTVLHTCERELYEKKRAEKKQAEKKQAKKKQAEKKQAKKEQAEKKLLKKKQKRKIPTPYIDLDPTTSPSELSDVPSNFYEPQSVKHQFQQAGRKCYSFPSSVTKRTLKPKPPSSKCSPQVLSFSSPTAKSTYQPRIVPPHTPPRLNSPFALPPTPCTPSNNNTVRFQFFTSNVHLGAIHKTFDVSMTPKAFFDEAFSAFTIIGEAPAASQMAGVRVAIKPSAGWPILVLWRNEESFYEMMEVVKERVAGRMGRLDIEVSCVLKGR